MLAPYGALTLWPYRAAVVLVSVTWTFVLTRQGRLGEVAVEGVVWILKEENLAEGGEWH